MIEVVGEARAEALAARAARLTGLQHYSVMAAATGAVDGGVEDAAHFLVRMFSGMGDKATMMDQSIAEAEILHEGFRVGRDMSGPLVVCFSRAGRRYGRGRSVLTGLPCLSHRSWRIKTKQPYVGRLKQPESLSNLMTFSLVRALD